MTADSTPMNKMDVRDLCVCDHSWLKHSRARGGCLAEMCRCEGFWKRPSPPSARTWFSRRRKEAQQ